MSKWYKIADYAWVNDGDGDYLDYLPAEETAQYTLTLSTSPTNAGTVSGGGTFDKGTAVTATATANEGYEFVNWNDGSTENPYTFELNQNVALIANFRSTSCIVTVNASPEAGGTVEGGGTYTRNTTATLTATANTDYVFSSWSDGSIENPHTIIVSEDIAIVAYFASTKEKYTVNIAVSPEGYGTITGAGEYEAGSQVTLTATPSEGNQFDSWVSLEINETINPYVFNIKQNMDIVANFSKSTVKYTINAVSADISRGAIRGSGTYEENTQVSLVADPNDGYEFDKWSDSTNSNPYKFNATQNLDLIGYFKKALVGALLVNLGSSVTVGYTLTGSFVNYNSNRNYKFYWSQDGENYIEWKTITSNEISLKVGNEFESLLPNNTSGTFYVRVEAIDSDGDVREYQTGIQFKVVVPDTFKPNITLGGINIVNAFNGSAISSYSGFNSSYTTSCDASSGYTNHATISNISASISKGSIRLNKANKTIEGSFSNSTVDYTTNFTLTVTDSRGREASITSEDTKVEGYTIPSINIKELYRCNSSGKKDEEGKYCYLEFDLEVADIPNNKFLSDEAEFVINDITEKGLTSTGENTYSIILGKNALETDMNYTITIQLQDSVIKQFSPDTKYIYIQNLLNRIPWSLRDDKTGNIGAAVGQEADEDNKYKIALNTEFGTDIMLSGSTSDGEVAEISAYELLNGGGEKSVKKVDTMRSGVAYYANLIQCMTGDEYDALSTKDEHTLYFLTSVPSGD